MPRNYYGYNVREPYKGELDYFNKNPNVSGMATEDKSIILNPFSKLNSQQQESVARNEAIRLWLKDKQINPDFAITPEQQKLFKGTSYEKDEMALKHTILGRMLTNDPSVGSPTQEQLQWAAFIKQWLGD